MKCLYIIFLLLVSCIVRADGEAPIKNLYTPPDSVVFIHNCNVTLSRLFSQRFVAQYCTCMNDFVNSKVMLYADAVLLEKAKGKCKNHLLEDIEQTK